MLIMEELRIQYCWRLDSLEGEYTSLPQIFTTLFDPKNKLYTNIEGILTILARGMMSMSVESVVESWISILVRERLKKNNEPPVHFTLDPPPPPPLQSEPPIVIFLKLIFIVPIV